MSQEGIFSIAPDAQQAYQNGNAGTVASPFTALTSSGGEASPPPNSPFAAVTASPFQQVHAETGDTGR